MFKINKRQLFSNFFFKETERLDTGKEYQINDTRKGYIRRNSVKYFIYNFFLFLYFQVKKKIHSNQPYHIERQPPPLSPAWTCYAQKHQYHWINGKYQIITQQVPLLCHPQMDWVWIIIIIIIAKKNHN